MPWTSDLPEELCDEGIVFISGTETVEAACEKIVSRGSTFLAVLSDESDTSSCVGLFDFADINTFLLLAIGAHVPSVDEPAAFHQIVGAAKAGRNIFVKDACNLSEKNPLTYLSSLSDMEALLRIFASGTHRVLLKDASGKVTGVISDGQLVRWFAEHAAIYPEFEATLELPLNHLDIGISKRVVSLPSEASVLDAMTLMHEQGVSSIAVIDADGALLSAVSVTDVGRLVATSPDRSVLSVSLSQFISLIKLPQGLTDGEDRYPIYSVTRQATLNRAIDLLLATNAHRLFITSAIPSANTTSSPLLNPLFYSHPALPLNHVASPCPVH